MRKHVFAFVATLLVAASASACINDSELPGHEREFRSQYNTPTAVSPNRSESQSFAMMPVLSLAAGALVIGCGVVAVRRTA
jgi:hypothetical protein